MHIDQLLTLFRQYPSINTDTRKTQPGDLFFGLRGDRFDGNKFAAQALEKGAARAIIDNPEYLQEGDERYILVKDSLKTLQNLARAWRRTFHIPFLGITGTNGKTTSKELIYSVLSTEKKAYATQGNFNNHIGVPLTLLGIPQDREIAIIEMGANQPGDIKELSEIAEPTHGMITNIGRAHLERFLSIDGVQKTKGELYDFMRERKGTIFLNETDPRVRKVAAGVDSVITFGEPVSDFWFEIQSHQLDSMKVKILSKKWDEPLVVNAQITGTHNGMNILAAAAIGDYFGISRAGIKAGIENYVSTNNRSQIIQRENYKIWMDAYNANPSSMEAAIKNIFETTTGKVALILGDMFELGKDEVKLHRDLGDFIRQFKPYRLIGIGPLMKEMTNVHSHAEWFNSVDEALPEIPKLIEGADLVMLKASRGMALEKLLERI